MWQLSLYFRGLKGETSFEAYTGHEDTLTVLLFSFVGKECVQFACFLHVFLFAVYLF